MAMGSPGWASVVLPAGKRRDRFVVGQSFSVSLVLILVTLIPGITGEAGSLYLGGAIILGSIFLCYNAHFAFRRSNVAARKLLAWSIAYLPFIFILLVVDKK